MKGWMRAAMIGAILFVVAGAPAIYFRAAYGHAKRLRVVTPGRVYRCGQLTEAGFADAVRRFNIRTVVNLQDEYPDPKISRTYLDRSTVRETEMCERLGVKYVFIAPDLLPRPQAAIERPRAVEQMLAVFKEPSNYPILVHCKAGLHRTGCMIALYRMEFEGWSPEQAVQEMREHGFGDTACTAANDYVYEYVLSHRRGQRQGEVTGLKSR